MKNLPAALVVFTLGIACVPMGQAQDAPPDAAFFQYITGKQSATMICYTPLELDPRDPANHQRLATSSIRKDLTALRPAFDGLVTYGYHEASTPRIVALAKELKFRAILLGIWDPKSAAEIDGVADLVRQLHEEMAIAVCVGNEGLTFNRYEVDDVKFAAARLRNKLPPGIPLTTSEPLDASRGEFVNGFGDFLAPNIHPVFHATELDAAQAAAWASDRAAELAKQSGKPVVLKETGFPHAGKQAYTPDSQRDFWIAYTRGPLLTKIDGQAEAYVFRGVAFEAFDLNWKAEATGLSVEKAWGLLSAERKPYPALEVWRKLAQPR